MIDILVDIGNVTTTPKTVPLVIQILVLSGITHPGYIIVVGSQSVSVRRRHCYASVGGAPRHTVVVVFVRLSVCVCVCVCYSAARFSP